MEQRFDSCSGAANGAVRPKIAIWCVVPALLPLLSTTRSFSGRRHTCVPNNACRRLRDKRIVHKCVHRPRELARSTKRNRRSAPRDEKQLESLGTLPTSSSYTALGCNFSAMKRHLRTLLYARGALRKSCIANRALGSTAMALSCTTLSVQSAKRLLRCTSDRCMSAQRDTQQKKSNHSTTLRFFAVFRSSRARIACSRASMYHFGSGAL